MFCKSMLENVEFCSEVGEVAEISHPNEQIQSFHNFEGAVRQSSKNCVFSKFRLNFQDKSSTTFSPKSFSYLNIKYGEQHLKTAFFQLF